MGWIRHKLAWDGMGWNRKICPMDKPVDSSKSEAFEAGVAEAALTIGDWFI